MADIEKLTQGEIEGDVYGIRGPKGDKGDKGDRGEQGVSVLSAVLNADYTLTLTLSDGTAYTTPSIRGEKGEKGEQGVQGIRGEKGDKGDKGDKGPAGYRFTNNNGHIVITEVD